MRRFYDFIRWVVVNPPLMLAGVLEVEGRETLPNDGAFILASTHSSWFDALWLARAVAPRRIHFMAKEELFRNPLFGWYLRSILAFPVNRDRLDIRTARHAGRVLESGGIVGVFPTGTRRGSMHSLKPGFALFSVLQGAPIVPATRTTVPNRGSWLRWRQLHIVTFGAPIIPPHRRSAKDLRHSVESLTRALTEALNELDMGKSDNGWLSTCSSSGEARQ
jgi:1-acyl-sn-glycerol-3-phosphate acyltransferase